MTPGEKSPASAPVCTCAFRGPADHLRPARIIQLLKAQWLSVSPGHAGKNPVRLGAHRAGRLTTVAEREREPRPGTSDKKSAPIWLPVRMPLECIGVKCEQMPFRSNCGHNITFVLLRTQVLVGRALVIAAGCPWQGVETSCGSPKKIRPWHWRITQYHFLVLFFPSFFFFCPPSRGRPPPGHWTFLCKCASEQKPQDQRSHAKV